MCFEQIKISGPQQKISQIAEVYILVDESNLHPGIKKTSYENANLSLFVFEWDKKFAIQKSQDKLYKGMYNFPFFKKV